MHHPRLFVGKLEGKRQIVSSRSKWKDNEVVESIQVACDKDQCRAMNQFTS
jgi:hypothetical protein